MINKMAVRTYISIITLNVNRLNAPTKRQRVPEWLQIKQKTKHVVEKSSFVPSNTCRLKMRVW